MILFTAIFLRIFIFNNAISVGEAREGGLIFYVDETGKHGLVSAMIDQAWRHPNGDTFVQSEWGCALRRIKGAEYTGIGDGIKNTLRICRDCKVSGSAAVICDNLYLNGFEDWYLPSKDELDLMYNNLYLNGFGDFAPGTYWTSSQSSMFAAWSQNFGGGAQNVIDKDNVAYVRAIRAF